MKRGGRGEKLLSALGLDGNAKKEEKNENPKPCRNHVKKPDKSSLAPDYVYAFDRGQWDVLDECLRKGYSKIQEAAPVPSFKTSVPTAMVQANLVTAAPVPVVLEPSTDDQSSISSSKTSVPTAMVQANLVTAAPVPVVLEPMTDDQSSVSSSKTSVPTAMVQANLVTAAPVPVVLEPSTDDQSSISSSKTSVPTAMVQANLVTAAPVPVVLEPMTDDQSSVSSSKTSVPTAMVQANLVTAAPVPVVLEPSTDDQSSISSSKTSVPTAMVQANLVTAAPVPVVLEPMTDDQSSVSSSKTSVPTAMVQANLVTAAPVPVVLEPLTDDQSSISDFSSGSDDIYSPGSIPCSSDYDSDVENIESSICTRSNILPGIETLTSRSCLTNSYDNVLNSNVDVIPKAFDEVRQPPEYMVENSSFCIEADVNSGINLYSDSNSVLEGSLSDNRATTSEVHGTKIELSKPLKRGSQRVYDKKQACLYCRKLICKLPQHFEHSHADKHEVSEYLGFPCGSKERVNSIRKLRNKGNFIHNSEVLKNNNGFLIVVRRSSNDVHYTKYLPCQYCFAFMHKRKLWRHAKTCPDRYEKQSTSKKSAVSNGYLLLPLSKNASHLFNETILKDMHEGDEKSLIKNDVTLCTFGSKQVIKHKFLPQQKNHISFKLRLLARLIIHLKKKQKVTHKIITSADHLVLKENFYTVTTAVNEISVDVGKPSLGKKLGHHLKRCAMIVRNRCIVEGNEILRRNVEDFLVLYNDEWDGLVSGPATDILNRRKYKKRTEIPTTDDIMKLNKHILKKEEEFIRNDFKNCTYTDVAKVVLTHVVVFNRRRVGEVSLMEVDSFRERITAEEPQGEIEKVLSQSEANMFSKLEIVYLRGKKGAKVDCLLTPNMSKCMQYLADNREQNGVSKDNIYMFCLPYSKHCMRGSDAIKEMVDQCGAKLPSQLTSTTLRKHISTVSQLLNLSDNNLNALCKHMGHNPSVHRQYYQMPEEMILKTQISKILVTLEQGNLLEHKGKKLNEFEVSIDNDHVAKSYPQTSSDSDEHESASEMSCKRKSVTDKPSTVTGKSTGLEFYEEDSSDSDSSGVKKIVKKKKNSPKSISSIDSSSKKKIVKNKTIKKSWSKEEIKILTEFFAEEIMLGVRPPTKKRCEECMKRFPLFKGLGSYLKIKWRVNAIIQEKKQKLKQ